MSNSSNGVIQNNLIFLSNKRHEGKLVLSSHHEEGDSQTNIYSMKSDRNWLVLDNPTEYDNELLYIHKDLALQINDAITTHYGGFNFGQFESPDFGFTKVELDNDDRPLLDKFGYPIDDDDEFEEEDEGFEESSSFSKPNKVFKFTNESDLSGKSVIVKVEIFNSLLQAIQMDTPIKYLKVGTYKPYPRREVTKLGNMNGYAEVSTHSNKIDTLVMFKKNNDSEFELLIELDFIKALLSMGGTNESFTTVPEYSDMLVKNVGKDKLAIQSIYSDGLRNPEEQEYGIITISVSALVGVVGI